MMENQLFKFAYCIKKVAKDSSSEMKFNDFLIELSSLAAHENWGTNNKVLWNYIIHTFNKVSRDYSDALTEQTKNEIFYFSQDRNIACFNTGLYTEGYEDIFMFFEKNRHPHASSPYLLKGFYKESDNKMGEVCNLPFRPRFFDNPDELIYDYRLEIRANIDHILSDEENIKRLPAELQAANPKYRNRVFSGALDEAKAKVAANYLLAVPQYYNDNIQLLIPLCLTSEEAQLAMVIQKTNGHYAARTCLTLDMAYNNARLIVKPAANWIVPA